MNVDVSASYRGIEVSGDHRWTMSLRRYGRTAFVELKRADEPMGLGQEIALHDITGHLTTHLGAAFEQRAFIVRRHGPFTISVSTLTDRKSNRVPPMLKWGTLTTVSNMGSAASVIGRWLADGRLFWDAEAA